MAIHVPVQTLAGVIEDSVHRESRGRRSGEQQGAGEAVCIRLAENQIPVPTQNPHVVRVLVERMLPTSLPDNPQQDLLAWMHMRVSVVGLVGIFGGVIGIHVIGHRAAVDHEVGRMIRLSRNHETAAHGTRCTIARGLSL
jgi:hypothetical protein